MNAQISSLSYLEAIPKLGVGIGFRPDFRAELFLKLSSVDFLEITADHYLNSHKAKQEELDLLQNNFCLIPHAINLSLGSADGMDMRYLEQLARLIDKVNPPYWSEHIAFTRVNGIEIGHLSPLPFSNEAIEVLCKNIETVQGVIARPLILENITYAFEIPGSEMPESEFLTKVVEATGTGLLLDATNLYTNSVNHHFDYKKFLASIPCERIIQLHFAGGYWQDDFLVDGHSHPAPPEVYEVMDYIFSLTSVKGVILERDENIPPFAELEKELQKAREIFR